jgi:hypothetical protein
MDTSDELLQILQNIEDEQATKKVAETISYLNKPEKIAISSNNAEPESNVYNQQTGNSFCNFTINLPRAAVGIKSLELLNANIPQAQVCIPDESLIFYYYKIKSQVNSTINQTIFKESPNINNMYYIRLLPSYYKPDLIVNPQLYGFNRSFNSYQDLATELSKACSNDLAYNSSIGQVEQFSPNDISITFNEEFNKFQMIGNNYLTPWEDNSIPIWNNTINYSIDTIVEYNGSYYIALEDNIGNIPPNHNDIWKLYTYPFYTYFSAGYEDPNVFTFANALFTIFTEWDFNFLSDEDVANRIYSIPIQPILQYQTLNLRLGFTFNGIYNWSYNTNVGLNANGGSDILVSVFNRLRPVPLYRTFAGLGGSSGIVNIGSTPFNNPTYTADSYANLVYSSIVNIYCSFIGPSTTDTQRNSSLLSIVPFNAGNLGITFYEPKISNKLTKITKDIYSMFFEFRREDGQPYYFPNSAIITLQFALSYE